MLARAVPRSGLRAGPGQPLKPRGLPLSPTCRTDAIADSAGPERVPDDLGPALQLPGDDSANDSSGPELGGSNWPSHLVIAKVFGSSSSARRRSLGSAQVEAPGNSKSVREVEAAIWAETVDAAPTPLINATVRLAEDTRFELVRA